MWQALVPVLRLEEDDPAAFWKRHGAVLKQRAAQLNDLQIRALRFRDDGTDLEVPLHASARWIGGGATTQGGIDFSPNIPTEEVFTAPYAPGVSGRVAITRPVRVLGGLVRDGWFEFRDGVVVDYGAATGRDHLTEFFSVDDGSRSIGEIALVDSSSPIYQTGLVFENILLDENAACHFALGSAYPTCIAGGVRMDEDELIAHGANRSRQHVDFMFGSDDIEVSAVGVDGESVPIMTNGRFRVLTIQGDSHDDPSDNAKVSIPVAFIGLGRIASLLEDDALREKPATHAGAVRANPACHIAGGFDKDPARRTAFKQRWNAPVYTDSRSLLETKPGIVIIATHPDSHGTYLKAAKKASVPVAICEKPVALTYRRARKLGALERDGRFRVVVNHERRFFPGLSTGATRDLGRAFWYAAGRPCPSVFWRHRPSRPGAAPRRHPPDRCDPFLDGRPNRHEEKNRPISVGSRVRVLPW